MLLLNVAVQDVLAGMCSGGRFRPARGHKHRGTCLLLAARVRTRCALRDRRRRSPCRMSDCLAWATVQRILGGSAVHTVVVEGRVERLSLLLW